MYCLIYIFCRFYCWCFNFLKNIFQNFSQILKSQWDSVDSNVDGDGEKNFICKCYENEMTLDLNYRSEVFLKFLSLVPAVLLQWQFLLYLIFYSMHIVKYRKWIFLIFNCNRYFFFSLTSYSPVCLDATATEIWMNYDGFFCQKIWMVDNVMIWKRGHRSDVRNTWKSHQNWHQASLNAARGANTAISWNI